MKISSSCWSGLMSPHVRQPKTILDSGFQAVDSRFLCQWDMDSGFLERNSEIQSQFNKS